MASIFGSRQVKAETQLRVHELTIFQAIMLENRGQKPIQGNLYCFELPINVRTKHIICLPYRSRVLPDRCFPLQS